MFTTKPDTHNLRGKHKQTFALRCRLDSTRYDETTDSCEDTSSSSVYYYSASSSSWSASSSFYVHMSVLCLIEQCETCNTRSLLFLTSLTAPAALSTTWY